ncbi:unnamed protein product [Tilletia controversa]|uniref:RRM domain-containing protein n=3 Tax=Tilletia TaxID=13289 RepID=A0A8X7ST19_9BASI|nr:hypothetical protein CF336_g7102 [Tilletia laevis]KAE8188034.1 hypothetical protein CF328_g6736 [Tilletia controversa]KAE8263229.1 hypothetical protein A4X03_0g1835 [Tilletia caries]KAE8187032.1 hypothetical protein CF335_g7283 [Tilletia laevis]KAE8239632.1 hypothetical protein A4X06_0g8156 [Tilletia controversa]
MVKKVKEERKRKRDEPEVGEPAAVKEEAPAPAAAVEGDDVAADDSSSGLQTKTKEKKKKDKSDKSSAKSKAASTEATAAADGDGDDDKTMDDAEPAQADGDEEVEALSHKERRKRRRLEKRTASLNANAAATDGASAGTPSSAGPIITSSSGQSSASKPAPRSQYSIWVGNLAFSTPPEKLQSWLEDRGVAGISRINMPKGARWHEHNKGFAYIDLPDETTLKYSISLSESPLDGRKLLIKDGKNFEGRPALSISAEAFSNDQGEAGEQSGASKTSAPGTANAALGKFAQSMLRSQKNAPNRTLFVGNLPFGATAEGLREILEIAAQRKLESEKDRVEAMELKELRRIRREEKEKKREEAALGKSKTDPGEGKKEDKESSDEEEDKKKVADEAANKDDKDDDDSSDDGDSNDEEESDEDDEKEPGAKKAKKSSKPKSDDPIGLVKVRLATFEDNPEKCKGFAFLDFSSTLYATRTLINPRNRYYLARKLVYEYAGEEAQRRSAGKKKISAEDRAAADWKRPQRQSSGRERSDDRRAPRKSFGDDSIPAERLFDHDEGEPTATAEGKKPTQAERAAARLAKGRGRSDDDRKMTRPSSRSGAAGSGEGRRLKPGAALANAARGKTGIVISEGKKITFE